MVKHWRVFRLFQGSSTPYLYFLCIFTKINIIIIIINGVSIFAYIYMQGTED